MHPPNHTKLPFWLKLAIAAFTLVYTWFYYQPMLTEPYMLNDDVVQHYLWLFVDYYGLNWKDTFYADASAAIQPRGFYYLLWLLGRVFDPITISRGGPFLISLLTVGFGMGLLRRYTHFFIALAGCLLAVHLGLHTSVGFLARSFLMPLLLAFGYYLLRADQPWGLAGVTVASALFYPPALLLNGGIFGLWKLGELVQWLRGRGRRMQGKVEEAKQLRSPFHRWYVHLLGFGIALLVVLAHAQRVDTHPTLGGYLPNEEMMSLPELGIGGRVDISGALRATPSRRIAYFFYNDARTPFGDWFANAVLVLVVIFTGLRYKKLGKPGAWLIAFGVSSLVLFYFARHEFPLLFLPSRYLAYPYRLWIPMLFTFLLAVGWSYYPKTWLAVLCGSLLLGLGYYRQPPSKMPVHTESGRAYLFDAIAQLPESALIALPPHMADQVPVFARRNVFISFESAHALYFQNYHDYVIPRYQDYIEAMTTTGNDLAGTVAFMNKWDIDYLIIDRQQLREAEFSSFVPFRRQFEDRLKGTNVEDRTLLQLPDSVGMLLRERLHIVSREEIEELVQ
ncbi:hypothetical protein FUA23_11560 [Neolewinella aurantiaca]|uniref:Glycosyltransferase RgtA/B/C/D-like domain-containing protein n=1 Tax=Neolewinella aurantiaca TaxID=2602767 RepID=A0A5C7FEF3_9BACT|nr:hypothetical protein [Neolewinella aurantiaca]TXF89141.1 hypothetical protein FUA23_11560 [Neolewinella aurantiaca]